jgi:type III secretion protein J
VTLHGGLTEPEANEIIAALHEQGIEARKVANKEGLSVSVRESELARAVEALSVLGLPHRRVSHLGDVFRKEGLISTPMEERARYVFALSQELEYTLSQIDGVISARVHVVLPEKPAPGEALQPPTAAVFIKHARGFDADLMASRIRYLVARSIPGLASQPVEKVSVVFVEGREQTPPFEPKNGGFPYGVLIGASLLAVAGLLATAGFERLRKCVDWLRAQVRRVAPQRRG